MSVKTLNDFLGNYLRTKKIEIGDEGFSNWMIQNGLNPGGTLDEKLTAAESTYARAKPGYGTTAESLAESGLSGSGYADYLTASAYSQMRKEKVDALKDYNTEMKKNAVGYADYLTEKNKESASLYRTVVGEIGSSHLLNREEAYDYAVRAGLDEESAASAADQGISEAKEKIRTKLASAMLNGKLTKERALRYATFFGLDKDDVEMITSLYGNSTDSDGETIPDGGQEFLQYLKEQANK